MNAVIGQEKLVKTLEGYTLDTTPKTMLFLGQSGCGKSWIAKAFAKQLDLEVVIVKPDSTAEMLLEYYQCPINKLYLIDLKDITEKDQNKFLKFIEEPSMYMHIILMAESTVGILPTILNRCIKYVFEPYTPEQLKQFDWTMNCSDEIAYEICKTPGQLLELAADNLDQVFNLCKTIISSIDKAGYANTLSIVSKINTKDDVNKIDFKLFFDIMTYTAFDDYKKNNNELSFKIYLYTIRYISETLKTTAAAAKEAFLLNYLDNIWRLAH